MQENGINLTECIALGLVKEDIYIARRISLLCIIIIE